MLPFHQVVQTDLEAVNALIIKQLHSDVELVENIGHYIVDAGGKRLRPLLVLLMAKSLSYEGANHHSLAAIIEFIHTATLLHDDVVDMSALRRGRPTANANWGNAPSVLVGDFLYSRAFQMMVGIGEMRIMGILSNTTNVISEGEVQQLVNAKNPNVTEADYFSVIHKKTAALFEAACETGSVIAGADDDTQKMSRKFGYHLGMAFQLVDDVLDYEGDAETLGKNLGDDLAEGKPTLPLIYAMNHSTKKDADLVSQAISNADASKLDAIVNIIKRCGGLDYTRACAADHALKAEQAIASLDPSQFKQALIELSQFSISRSY